MAEITHLLHNQVIPYNAIKLRIPPRNAFISKQDAAKVDNILKDKQSLMFLPTYLMETSMQDVKYEKALYKIILMGIAQDGRRINVIIDNIQLYFEVQLPETREDQEKALSTIVDLLENDELTTPTKTAIINSKPFKYYHEKKVKFVRFYYNKTKNRAEAIKLIKKNGYTTTSDDLASYYRVVCRDHLTTFSSWAVLDKYKKEDVELLKGTTYRVSIDNYKAYTGELTGDLLKDKTVSCCWDIETWSKDGDVPMPENKDDNIFCLSMTFQYVNDKDPFLKVCLCDYPANAKPDYLTVVCGTEKNIIRGFADIFELIRPEFIIGFNDSDYDWNWVIKRAKYYNGLLSYVATKLDSTKPYQPYTDESVYKWNFKKEHVKVEADTYIDGFALMVPGYIPVDVRTIFRRLYPTAEQSSLKWFLAKNKLGGKEDMPYEEMFRIYREYRDFMLRHSDEATNLLNGTATELISDIWGPKETDIYNTLKAKLMAVNYYCVIDAQRCHDLMTIRSVIMDHREVSNIAYCSVYDAFFRANGMKVRNLTIAIGQQAPFNMRFSNIANEGAEEGKYPGGFVLPPNKGLKISKLSIEERIRKAAITKTMPSPACQDWLNTTQEEITKYYKLIEKYGATGTKEQIELVEAETGEKLPKKFKDFWLEPIGRPITGLDFSSLYPSLIRAYNFSPEYCILDKKKAQEIAESGQKITKVDFNFQGKRKLAYFVWHNNKYDTKEEGFQFGVYPYILDDLFKKRAVLKKKMKVFEHRKEEIEAMSEEQQKALEDEYSDVIFNKNYLNSKQNALKVFMNTFYGEAGNKRSPFFVLEVAGGVTTYGQKNIRFAYAFVKGQGCNVYYGDSVAEYTPMLLKVDNISQYCEIRDIVDDSAYEEYNDGKEIAILQNVEVWSDVGWTKVKHIIRHKTDKQMYRVLTHNGAIDVTEDHSLLLENGTPVKPNECIGAKLLVKGHPNLIGTTDKITADLAWVLGFFVAEGSCGDYECASGNKASWGLVNQDLTLLNKSKTILENEYPDYTWKILNCMESSAVYKLVPIASGVSGKIKTIVKKWRAMCYYRDSKVVPDEVFESTANVQLEFLKGYYWGDGDKSSNNNNYNSNFTDLSKRFDIKTQMSAYSMYKLCKNLGYKVSLNCRADKIDIYRLTITTKTQRKIGNQVKTIMELPKTKQYVYDLETENHHFSAGVGDLVVHNTDSLYLSTPERFFAPSDIAYYSGNMAKLDYWTKLVEITFKEINPIRDGVNKAFIEDNGTQFLSMAYEEVLSPTVLTAKKKYFGIAHENIPNFKPKELFIRGLEVKKRGVSELLRTIFMELMWMSCSVDNIYDLVELVIMKIDEIYSRKWTSRDFVQTGVYRPNKKNVKIHTFVKRMQERGLVIKPNERFNYVIIKKYPYAYDLRGRKVELSIGDRLELAEEFEKDSTMEIDLDYYMKGSISGQLARLITYHEMFKIDPIDNTPEELKIAEDRIYKNACKFIDAYCDKYYANYNSFGKTHQKIFKTASKSLSNVIKTQDSLVSDLLNANVDYDDFETWFVEYTEKKADKVISGYGKAFIEQELDSVSSMVLEKYKNDLVTDDAEKLALITKETKQRRIEKLQMLQRSYYGIKNSILAQRDLNYRNTMSILRKKLRENYQKYMKVYGKYNSTLEDVMNQMRSKIGKLDDLMKPTKTPQNMGLDDFNCDSIDENIDSYAETQATTLLQDSQFCSIINDLKILHNNLLSAHVVIKRTRDIVDYLKICRDKAAKMCIMPSEKAIKQMIDAELANNHDTDDLDL